ncbi:hypothetical protein [Haladaptatus litoreus]|uniref:hypothetical protein n=1 Tax=Haladaptatus litoreus TaxID=553468 RepID=UPI0011155B27|nr:hypothetical protein [Haladaptatus litoreus]
MCRAIRPKGQRIRFAFLALTSVGIAGIVVPVAVFESDWTQSLDSVALLATAVTGSVLVLWASSETTNRLSSGA